MKISSVFQSDFLTSDSLVSAYVFDCERQQRKPGIGNDLIQWSIHLKNTPKNGLKVNLECQKHTFKKQGHMARAYGLKASLLEVKVL